MFLRVTAVSYLEDYKLRVTFNDGAEKEVDLQDDLYGEVFEPLKDLAYFRQVLVNPDTNTIEWPNGADYAPEFLYKLGAEMKQVA